MGVERSVKNAVEKAKKAPFVLGVDAGTENFALVLIRPLFGGKRGRVRGLLLLPRLSSLPALELRLFYAGPGTIEGVLELARRAAREVKKERLIFAPERFTFYAGKLSRAAETGNRLLGALEAGLLSKGLSFERLEAPYATWTADVLKAYPPLKKHRRKRKLLSKSALSELYAVKRLLKESKEFKEAWVRGDHVADALLISLRALVVAGVLEKQQAF